MASKWKYPCANSRCRRCYFFNPRGTFCEYYLQTNKHKHGSGINCDSLLPAVLIRSHYEADAKFLGCSKLMDDVNICRTADGIYYDVTPLTRGNAPLQLVGGEWIPAEDYSMAAFESAVPLSLADIPKDINK